MQMSPDAERLLSQARRRRVHGMVIALVILIPRVFLALHYGLYAGWFGSFLLSPALTLIWQAAVHQPPIFVLASTFQKGDKLVLWLRRFHVRRPGGMKFDRLLQDSCRGLGFPLTVQDSTFRWSLGMSAVKMQILATP